MTHRVVYVSYDGLLDPLGQSQILPYVIALADDGHDFHLVTFEKPDRTDEEIAAQAADLRARGIAWTRLPFLGAATGLLRALLGGARALRRISARTGRTFVHIRGFPAMLMHALSGVRLPYLYDFRGFALEEWGDIGKVRRGSPIYRVLRHIDRRAVQRAAALVVLEEPALTLLRQTYPVPDVPVAVVRTVTDVRRYGPRGEVPASGSLRLVWLGGGRFPYRPDHALRLASAIAASGTGVTLTFFNERDHDQIRAAAAAVAFPTSHLVVRRIAHRDVAVALSEFDAGLVFIETSPWRRVCSPTKIGEYLAAGLPVIADPFCEAAAEVARRTGVIRLVDPAAIERGLSAAEVDAIVRFILAPGLTDRCRAVAASEFDLAFAVDRYRDVYARVA